MTRSAIRSALLTILVLGPAGCASKPPRVEDPDTSNLRRIYQAIRTCEEARNRPLRDGEELKYWLGQLGEAGTPDDFVISRRDGQAFVVYYGTATNPDAGDAILAYEQNGAESKRFVLTISGRILTLTDEEFAKAKFVGKKPTKSGG